MAHLQALQHLVQGAARQVATLPAASRIRSQPQTWEARLPSPVPVRKLFSPNGSLVAGSVRRWSPECAAVQPKLAGSEVPSLQRIKEQLLEAGDRSSRYHLLLDYARRLQRLPDEDKTPSNRVMGCTSQVWVTARLDQDGRVWFAGDSDSELTRGLCAILVEALTGLHPEEVARVGKDDLLSLGLGSAVTARSRINGFLNMLEAMKKRARGLAAARQGGLVVEPFPSLVITGGGEEIEAQGDFAVSQAQYLQPDAAAVAELVQLLQEKRIGVVAHFYMDPQVQGVLAAAAKQWPHVFISDSLVMADRAVRMAQEGCEAITVLGVDFMSENVRAILDRGGFPHVPVYRMADESIGCSLAEAAESSHYMSYLSEAAATPASLHVIYINTSLRTKAQAHALVPTITCTSSNVVQTVLQALAQVPEATVWYGPDTYMGGNLSVLFRQLSLLGDEEIARVHPAHNRDTIRALLPRLHYFQEGNCIVHDLFGHDVVTRVRDGYIDAYQAAHFEVPGEMFELAMEARQRGMGVVGSTKNILDFIVEKTGAALERGFDDRLQFVLGTEAGMVTSIVNATRDLLRGARAKGNNADVEVEIVFPVSSDAITSTAPNGSSYSATNASVPSVSSRPTNGGAATPSALADLKVVPGVSGGEGCSISGGCASCPYMKMNSLSSLLRVCRTIGTPGEPVLAAYRPRMFLEPVAGHNAAELGSESILHMRHFQKTGHLSDTLVKDIRTRHQRHAEVAS